MFGPLQSWNDFLRFISIAPAPKKRRTPRRQRMEALETRALLSATVSVAAQNNASPGTPGVFVISLSQSVNETVSVGYSVQGSDSDDPSGGGSVYLGSSVVSTTVSVDSLTDSDGDAGSPEPVTMSLVSIGSTYGDVMIGSPSSATMSVEEAGGGGTPTITISNSGPVTEGSPITFNIQASGLSSGATVSYNTADGTAVSNTTDPNTYDYDAASGSFTVDSGGNGGQAVTVYTNDDGGSGEGPQTFSLTAGGGSAMQTDSATINEDSNDTSAASISVTDNGPETEGLPITFTIDASGLTPGALVSYGTANGTAVSNNTNPSDFDYYSQSGSFYVDSTGAGSQTVTVNTNDDGGSGEGPQTFSLTASGGGGSGSDTTATIEEDNDATTTYTVQPTVFVSNSPVFNEANGTLTFPVSITNPDSAPITLFYKSVDGTATSGIDYQGTGTSGTSLVIPAETTAWSIPVTIYDDHRMEEPSEETFSSETSQPLPWNATGADLLPALEAGTNESFDVLFDTYEDTSPITSGTFTLRAYPRTRAVRSVTIAN